MFYSIGFYIIGGIELLFGLLTLTDNLGEMSVYIFLVFLVAAFQSCALGFLLQKTIQINENIEYLQNGDISRIEKKLENIEEEIEKNNRPSSN